MGSWTSLPRQWRLEDVQAGLNVFITALSALIIFVVVRLSWQSGARRIAQNKAAPLSSILTINTPGEVLDAVTILRNTLPEHGRILAQCMVVVIFSITTLVSGPIARYASRTTTTVIETDVDGYLAMRSHNSNGNDQVLWNLTMTSLDRANFPIDQMVDFLPDTGSHWLYNPDEWNNTWSLNCKSIESTPVDIVMSENCSTFSAKMLGREFVDGAGQYSDYRWNSHSDFYVNSTLYRDVLMFAYNANYTDYDEETYVYQRVSMSLAALLMHHVPKNSTEGASFDGACTFGTGPVESSSFTRIDCEILYEPVNVSDPNVGAYPDTGDVNAIPSAFTQFYFSRFKQESIRNGPITIISPRELRRFFQTYIVSKDIQDRTPVTRQLKVEVPVVQISTPFLVIYCFIAFLVVLGALVYAAFLFRHRAILSLFPQSKLDWIVQATANGAYAEPFQPNQPIWVVSSAPQVDVSRLPQNHRKRVLFESASYSPRWPQPATPQHMVYPDKRGLASPTSPMSPDSGFSGVHSPRS